MLVGAFVLPSKSALARAPDAPKGPVVFTGVRVVVEGQKIKAIEPENRPLPEGALVIAGGGRTLMPGLIDAHVHAVMAALPMATLLSATEAYLNFKAAEEAERTLMRGFTSVRDMAGPTFSMKRVIDEGGFAGPRIWPSGAMISQTSGHGDYRQPYDLPAGNNSPTPRTDAIGAMSIADGVSEVLKRSREQLMLGASQLKLAAGGGAHRSTTRWMCRSSPRRSFALRWTRQKTGALMSPCMPTRHAPSRRPSVAACAASNTAS